MEKFYLRYTSDYWQVETHILEKHRYWVFVHNKLKQCYIVDANRLWKYLKDNNKDLTTYCKSVKNKEAFYIRANKNGIFIGNKKNELPIDSFCVKENKIDDEMKIYYNNVLKFDNKEDFYNNI